MEKCQVILQVIAAGGKLTLYGRQTQNGWLFSRQVIDQTPELLNESAVNHNSGVVNSWTAALELMDHYRWHMLNPVIIHVAFRDVIIQVVESRLKGESDSGSPRLADWLTHCNVDGWTQ